MLAFESNQYKRIYLNIRGQSYTVGLHRLAFWVDKDFAPLNWENDVSHLCHLRSCADPKHLNLESHKINLNRNQCVKAKKCFTHGTEPLCML